MDNAPRMKAVAGSRIIGTGSALPQRAVGNEELVATGATIVGAACPFCNTMFRDALSGISKTPPKLLDIAQIAAIAIANKSSNTRG